MVQISHRRGREWPGLPAIPEERSRSQEGSLEWLYSPPLRRTPENPSILDETESVQVPVGSYTYWIQVRQWRPALCRMACRKDALILYEVLAHDNLGITDDDLEHAILYAEGDFKVSGEYRISDHIKTKLQILYEP